MYERYTAVGQKWVPPTEYPTIYARAESMTREVESWFLLSCSIMGLGIPQERLFDPIVLNLAHGILG